MKNQKTKLTVALLTVFCASICVGTGVAVQKNAPMQTSITAKAEVEYTNVITITKLGALNSSTASVINGYAVNSETERPTVAGDWDNKFTFAEGSGVGFTYNGETLTGWEIKQPGHDFYIVLGGKTAVAGDIVVLDGDFVNDSIAKKITFKNCALQFDGAKWVEVKAPVQYATYKTTKVGANSDSSATAVFLHVIDGEAFPKDQGDWDNVYTFEAGSGEGLKLGETALTTTDIKFPGDFFINLGATAQEGDILTIDGAYYNESKAIKLVFDNCQIQFKNGVWTAYEEAVEVVYTTYEIGALKVHTNSLGYADNVPKATQLYMTPATGSLPIQDANWAAKFAAESGVGIKVNGETYTAKMVSSNAGLYLGLPELNVGDVVTIGGTFVYEDGKAKYVIEETTFQWCGNAWEIYTEYTTYETGKLAVGGGSSATAMYIAKADGTGFEVTESTWTERLKWWGDGVGITFNGEQIATKNTDFKIPGNIYLGLKGKTAVAGDEVVVSGTFYNATLKVKYVVTETKFTFNGTAWEVVGGAVTPDEPEVPEVEYTNVITITNLGALGSSNAGMINGYAVNTETERPTVAGDWDNKFSFKAGSGDGFLFNGEELTGWEIKQPGYDFYIVLGKEASEGDIITLDGEFVNDSIAKKIVFVDCVLQFDGTAWVIYEEKPEINYTTYTVTKIGGWVGGNSNEQLFIYSLSDESLPKETGEWESFYTLEAGSGNGLTYNGTVVNVTDIKQPGDMFFGWGITPVEGDKIVLDGTYYNEAKAQKFVFVNCEAEFKDGKWVSVGGAVTPDPEPDVPDTPVTPPTDVEFTTYTVKTLGSTRDSSAKAVYFYTANGDALPKDKGNWQDVYEFETGSGTGLTLNGTALTTKDIKLPGDLYINLGVEAQAGDVLVLDGTYFNANTGVKIVFQNCSMEFDGEKWNACVQYDVYQIPQMKALSASSASAVHLVRADGEAIEIVTGDKSWDIVFKFKEGTGSGVALNGVQLAINNQHLKFPGEMYVGLGTSAKQGDILKIGGEFYNDAYAVKYVIEETSLMWNGTAWEVYNSMYDDVMVGAVTVAGDISSADAVYLNCEVTLPVNSWDNAFSYMSGTGITLNGKMISMENAMKSVEGKIYVALSKTAQEGDTLRIGGKFLSEADGVVYIIQDSEFVFEDGAWWQAVAYTTYNLGTLKLASTSTAPSSAKAEEIYLRQESGAALPVQDWNYYFLWDDDENVLLNDDPAITGGLKSTSSGLYLVVYGAEEGDVVTIQGTFYCEAQAVKYVIEKTELTWNGTAWEIPMEYTEEEIGKLVVNPNSNGTTQNVPKATQLYLSRANGHGFPLQNWEVTFAHTKGLGAQLNGNPIVLAEMKSTDAGLFLAFAEVQVGDVLTIGGEFTCASEGIVYHIEESKFVWNGKTWENYVVYEKVEVGAMIIQPVNSSASVIYMYRMDGGSFPVQNWDDQFLFRAGTGIGITCNGTPINSWEMKSPGDIYLGLGFNAAVGDVVAVGGEFYSPANGYAYVIAETVFVYDGENWVNRLDSVKAEGKVALQEAQAQYAESDYYAEEWAEIQKIFAEAEAAITDAMTESAVEAIVAEAIAAANDVVTKTESDAMLSGLYATAKAELMTYKLQADYRAEDWTAIQAIITQAKADIDAATSVTAIRNIVKEAKAAMDAFMTAEEWTAAEAVVAAAKAELASYKAQADYREQEWTVIENIINQANKLLDAAIAQDALIADIVADAKANMDKVKTADVAIADEAAVAAAKAELEGYKSMIDYDADGWVEIQTILNKAYADVDAAIGNQEAIDGIVAAAKAEMDKVLTAEEVIAQAFENAKKAAKALIKNFYDTLDFDAYEEDALGLINGYVAMAMDAIDKATTADEIEIIITEFQMNVDDVEKIEKPSKKSGCGSMVGSGLAMSGVALAAAAIVTARKKKED